MHGQSLTPELPNLISFLARAFKGNVFIQSLVSWENIIFSLAIVIILSAFSYLAGRKPKPIPSGLQNVGEILVEGLDNFVCAIIGPRGRKFTPFIGTLFIYILFMNLSGIVPFIKPATASWSTTLALSLCVFTYVQYTAVKEMGVVGYADHLAGKPRGAFLFTLFIPLLMFFLHTISELVRPLSLSLRLRSNIWGDDVLIAILAGFGAKGIPLLVFNMLMAILTSVMQAVVFCLLSTVYFALALKHE